MAPPRVGDFKASTYERLPHFTQAWFNTIKTAVETLHNQTDPLSPVQLKTLTLFS